LRERTDWRKSRQSGCAGEREVLFVFVKNAVSDREILDPGPKEASKRVFRGS
jgi:hypothetical protein